MKKSIIKTLVLVGILLAVLSFASCKKDKNPVDGGSEGGSTGTSYKITYVLNGGTNPADAVTSYDGSKITSFLHLHVKDMNSNNGILMLNFQANLFM